MKTRRPIVLLFALMALFLSAVTGTLAQASDGLTRTDQPQFLAYTCRYNEDTARTEILAALTAPSGGPVAEGDISTVTVARTGGDPLPAESVSIAPSDGRPPLRMVLVLDTTDTMPLSQIQGVLLGPTGFLPGLQVEDEVALVAVDATVTNPTPFYTDKNALYNDHVADLTVREGNNVIYEGVRAGVGATTPNSPVRQVVVVITDSGYADSRADEAEALVTEIITVAQASKAQIFPISFSSLNAVNVPDDALLARLAAETGGVAWSYSGDKSPAAISAAVTTALEELYATLNAEVVISADLTGLEADETGFVPLDVTVTLASGAELTSRVACPPPPAAGVESVVPLFTVAYRNLVEGLLVTEPLLVQIASQPEPLPPDAIFRFFLDDEPTDNTTPEFTISPDVLDPGVHTMRVQLRDGSGNTLAATPTVTFYTQRPLVLTTGSGTTAGLSGPLTLRASNVSPNIGSVEFTLINANDPTQRLALGTVAAQDGAAVLEVPNIQESANSLVPDQTGGWNLQVVAVAPAASPDSPPLGVSNTLNLSVEALPVGPVMDTVTITGIIVPVIIGLVLLLLDVFLLGRIRKARIQKKINRPDGYDLSPNLMQLTVSRSGNRQVYVLTKKTLYIGRGSGNDISLDDDANVSRQHGVVMWRGQKWWYANRKPKVKSRVNGKNLKGIALVKLENPTEINIGDYQVVFHGDSQRDTSDLVKTNL
ncbi:MAG TPA: FHA domain-containing protein [Candidatus Limnocylindrales bacterium]|nr:FHA domain-containing protein [Candidatus Limnocylindrales bacterium]